MALLLPVLSKVKIRAKRVVCMGQQKNQSTAMFMFLGDHDSAFPVMDDCAPYNPWYSLIGQKVGGGMPAEDRKLNEYLGNSEEVSHCPDDRGQASSFATWENGSKVSVYDQLGFSYGYAQHSTLWGVQAVVKHSGKPVRVTKLKGSLSTKFLLSEWNYFPNREWAVPVNRWHSDSGAYDFSIRKMVTSFADGHTEYFTFPSNWDSGRPIGTAVDPTSELW